MSRLRQTVQYAVRAACPAIASWRRRLYHSADLLLPNSQAEAEQLMRLFQVPPSRIRIVPNGVEEHFADADPQLFRTHIGWDNFVLCPGRIEPRKNQLSLIRALHGSGIRLVFAGEAATGHRSLF
ncbi:MAG: glycosyltransferase [Pirellulales bacterium]